MDDVPADAQAPAEVPAQEPPQAEPENVDLGQPEGPIGQPDQLEEVPEQNYGGIDPNQ